MRKTLVAFNLFLRRAVLVLGLLRPNETYKEKKPTMITSPVEPRVFASFRTIDSFEGQDICMWVQQATSSLQAMIPQNGKPLRIRPDTDNIYLEIYQRASSEKQTGV